MAVFLGYTKPKPIAKEEAVDPIVFKGLKRLESLEEAVHPTAVADARLKLRRGEQVYHGPIYVYGTFYNGGKKGSLIYRPFDPLKPILAIMFKDIYLFHIIGKYPKSLAEKVTKLLTPPDQEA